MKKVDAIFFVAIALTAVVSIGAVNVNSVPQEEVCKSVTVRTPKEIVKRKQAPIEKEPLIVEPSVTLYDVPLSEELQIHIIGVCEEYNIDPAIVIAMCYRESSYNADAIGDNGDSFGLMQIQPKWNYQLMSELRCYNLLDPFQNVKVGTAILAGQIDRYDDVTKALVAYNQGDFKGTITQYAKDVLEKAEELKGETYVLFR